MSPSPWEYFMSEILTTIVLIYNFFYDRRVCKLVIQYYNILATQEKKR